MSTDDEPRPDKRGSHNEIGYRNVDEEGQHDERGSQGPGRGEPDPNEGTRPPDAAEGA
jgi:hypothetical protein